MTFSPTDDAARFATCPECGEPILRSFRFCPHCGHRLDAPDAPAGGPPRLTRQQLEASNATLLKHLHTNRRWFITVAILGGIMTTCQVAGPSFNRFAEGVQAEECRRAGGIFYVTSPGHGTCYR